MSLEKYPNFLLNLSEIEMHSESDGLYEFKTFRLDVAERSLTNAGVKLPVTPKAFSILVILVANAGHVVTKEDLIQLVWPDSFVEEANLARTIHTLRRTLGENGEKLIETVSKKGYRFIAPVKTLRRPGEEVVEYNGSFASVDDEPTVPPSVGIVSSSRKVTGKYKYAVFAAAGLCTMLVGFLLVSFQPWRSKSPAAKRITSNEEANRLYLLGSALNNKTGRKNGEKAVEYFTQVISLDPDFAPAYAGLANAHTSMAITAAGDTQERYIKAKAAIEKAMAIDNDLAETHSALGELKWICEWDFPGAEAAHKRALELDPGIAQFHRKYAVYLLSRTRFDEAIAEIKTAIDLDPALPANHRAFAQILLYARRYDEAIVRAKQTLEMDSDVAVAHNFLIGSYRAKGDDAQAFEWFLGLEKANGGKPEELQAWRAIYDQSGWRGIYERQFAEAREAEKNGEPNYMYLANLATELDLHDQAFAYLEKTYNKRQWAMVMLNANPRYDPLRPDPRFDTLLKRVGLK